MRLQANSRVWDERGSFSEVRFSEYPFEIVVGWKSNVRHGGIGQVILREWRQVVTCGWTIDHQCSHIPCHEEVTHLYEHTETDIIGYIGTCKYSIDIDGNELLIN